MKQTMHAGHYESYLLRVWRGDNENDRRWLLQNIRTGEQTGFSDINALLRFLSGIHDQTTGPTVPQEGETK